MQCESHFPNLILNIITDPILVGTEYKIHCFHNEEVILFQFFKSEFYHLGICAIQFIYGRKIVKSLCYHWCLCAPCIFHNKWQLNYDGMQVKNPLCFLPSLTVQHLLSKDICQFSLKAVPSVGKIHLYHKWGHNQKFPCEYEAVIYCTIFHLGCPIHF